MTFSRRHRFLAGALRGLVAAGGVALVLLLTVLTASPDLHRWVHGHDVGADDGCAVVQFAQGVSVALDTARLVFVAAPEYRLVRPDAREIFVASPRHLHPPERGPPVA